MKVKYNKGGKSPVDPPKTSPESKSTYKIGNMHFMGEEADRLIAFDEYLENQFPNLDLFQRAEQVEKFLNANAHKSNEAMDSYSVDPSLAEEKASTISDMFESEFGSSMFGGSDPFDDDPDVQRMREEAAARENKKGKRNKRFENGGVTMKVKYGKGGSSDGMYAEAGALITGLAKNKELRDAMKAELAKYEEGGSVTGGDKGKKGDSVKEVRTLEKGGEELIGVVSDAMQRVMFNSADANLNKPGYREDYEKVMSMIGKGGSVADVSKALSYLEKSDLGYQMTKGNPTFMEDLRKDVFQMQYAIPSADSEKGFRYLTDEEAAEYESRKGKKF